MTPKRLKTITADGSDGRVYTIHEWGHPRPSGNLGRTDLITSDGDRCNFKRDGTFEVVKTGVVLTPRD